MSRLPVTDRSCERSQTFNSPDFYMEWNAHNSLHLNAKTQKWYNTPNICKQDYTKMMQVPPMPSLLIPYTIFQILLSWIAVGIVTRLSTWIPRLPLNVTDRALNILKLLIPQISMKLKSFNLPDFDGMKCTQLSPLKYKKFKKWYNICKQGCTNMI